jgi:hypothetical protein
MRAGEVKINWNYLPYHCYLRCICLTKNTFAMGPIDQHRRENSSPNASGHPHFSTSIEERIEILAQDPYRFYLAPTVFYYRGEQRIDLLDQYLDECIMNEKYELCSRIRKVQRLLLQKIWRDKNPVRPEVGPVRVQCIFSGMDRDVQDHDVECDLADDPMTIFRSIDMKKLQEFIRPLILKPYSPDIPMLVYSSFPFPVEQICVTRSTGWVENISRISPSKGSGPFIQSFTGHSMVILAPKGFIKKHRIEVGVTSVELINVVPY